MPQPNYLFDAGHNKREGFTKPETNDEIMNALFLAEYETLETDNKTIGGAINELKSSFQNYYTSNEVDNLIIRSLFDNEYETLETDNKTIGGAINEINSKFGNYYTKQEIDVMIENIYPTNTAAGAVANFKTALNYPLQSLTAQIVEMQATGTPTPENPLSINGWNSVKITKCGKNMFDINYLSADGITISNNEVIGQAQILSNNFGLNTDGLKQFRFKANTRYTISFKAYTDGSYSTSGTGIYFKINYTDGSYSSISVPNNQQEFGYFEKTSNVNKTISKIQLAYSSAYSNTWHLKELQLEEGTTASIFELYNGNNIIISLGGNYYGGYITQAKNGARNLILTHKMLDWSNLTFRRSNNNGAWANYLFFAPVSDMKYNYNQKSDIYEIQTTGNIGDIGNYKFITSFSGSVPYVYFRNDDYIDVETFTLAMNDHQFLYEMTDSIIISLSGGELITPFIGINNIFADSGDVSVDFKQDVANYVQSLIGG